MTVPENVAHLAVTIDVLPRFYSINHILSKCSSKFKSDARTKGDIVNSESVPGKTGSLSVSSYSPHSMMAIHYVPLWLNSLCPPVAPPCPPVAPPDK